MVKVVFHAIRNCSLRKEFAPSGSKFFPIREVPIMKRDAIEENHCLIQQSSFDVSNFFSVLATPLKPDKALRVVKPDLEPNCLERLIISRRKKVTSRHL